MWGNVDLICVAVSQRIIWNINIHEDTKWITYPGGWYKIYIFITLLEILLKIVLNVYGKKPCIYILTEKVGFTQSEVDECDFYNGCVVYVIYT